MPRRSCTGSCCITSVPSTSIAPDGRLDQPVDHLHRRGLAAAGRPDEDDGLALLDVERETVHGRRAGPETFDDVASEIIASHSPTPEFRRRSGVPSVPLLELSSTPPTMSEITL